MFEPQRREAFCDYLVAQNNHGKAAAELAKCLEDNDFVSPSGKSKHQLWMRLCDLCAAHPEELPRRWASIRSSGAAYLGSEMKRDGVVQAADYYIRLGRFEEARNVYEEAVTTVVTAGTLGWCLTLI